MYLIRSRIAYLTRERGPQRSEVAAGVVESALQLRQLFLAGFRHVHPGDGSLDASGLDLRVTHAGVVNETGKPYARERFVREAQTREVGDSVESANSRRPRTVIAVPRHPVAADLEAPGATGPGLRAERRERQPHFDREEATFAARCAGGLPLAVPTGVLGPTVEPGAARVHDELEVGLTAWSG